MGALHDALAAATTREERREILLDAYAALDARVRTVERGQFTITILARPIRRTRTVRFRVRIVRTSNGRDVTPDDLNPIDVANPPYLVLDPAGDVVRMEPDPKTGEPVVVTYREDLEAVLRKIIVNLLRQRLG